MVEDTRERRNSWVLFIKLSTTIIIFIIILLVITIEYIESRNILFLMSIIPVVVILLAIMGRLYGEDNNEVKEESHEI